MKNLLISLIFGMLGLFLHAQDHYVSATLHPQLGSLSSLYGKGKARALSMELNLGRDLNKGKVLEAGIGLRQQRFCFRYAADLEKGSGTYYQQSTLAVAPARLRLHLNRRSEGRHQVWLNLGYIYGRRILADAWMRFDRASEPAVQQALLVGGKNYHFVELGLEMEAPLAQKYRVGLSINYTYTLTAGGSSSYSNSILQLPGIKIRFARRVR